MDLKREPEFSTNCEYAIINEKKELTPIVRFDPDGKINKKQYQERISDQLQNNIDLLERSCSCVGRLIICTQTHEPKYRTCFGTAFMVAYPRNLTITDRFTEIKKEIGALALTAGHNGRESESLFGYKPYRWIFCPVAYNDITDFEKVNLLEKWTYGPLYECVPMKGFLDEHENNILYNPINGNEHKFSLVL